MRVTRRTLLAILASLGLHLLAAAAIVGGALWGAWPREPIDVEITGMRLEDLNDLPLGLPASGSNQIEGVAAPAPRAPAPRPAAAKHPDGADAKEPPERARGPKIDHRTAASDPDGGTAGPARPTSVRSYAPEGSRVSALLRVDRLRDTPYAPMVDALLMNLPDRRDLLEGTGLDLYRDIDAVLIATPNPLDATVTFLAARHRLSDTALRSALEKGARATGRRLIWRTERGRPFAERRSAAAPVAGDQSSGPRPASNSRDQRLILLAAPKLVVVTPPAYRTLILRAGGTNPVRAPPRLAPDGGASVGEGDAGVAVTAVDGGAQPAGAPADPNNWALLIRRIDAEDSILPPDAVAMVSAADLFSARTLRGTLDVAPGTRGAVDDDTAAAAGATVMGLPVPRLVIATMGILPQPFADIDAEFSQEVDAARWEEEWPKLRHKLLTNPLVVLSGFGGLIGHAALHRAGATVHMRVDATELEAVRLLQIIASQMPALRR
ncbi:MAG: hypothetical protein ABUS79_02340 [Pseudomonadota bacterium]